MRFVPNNNVIALALGPLVWLVYFVATYLVTQLGCNRGWYDIRWLGFALLDVLLWAIVAIGILLISYVGWRSHGNLKSAKNPVVTQDAAARQRRSFIAKSGFFLSGISLLGTVWGAATILIFDACGL